MKPQTCHKKTLPLTFNAVSPYSFGCKHIVHYIHSGFKDISALTVALYERENDFDDFNEFHVSKSSLASNDVLYGCL